MSPNVNIDSKLGVVVNDIDGDGQNELITWAGQSIRVLDGDLNTIWPYSTPAVINNALIVVDVDRDGQNDIIVSADQTYVIGVYENSISAKGDINGDGAADLQDAIIVLKVVTGQDVTGLIRSDYATSGADVNGDNRVGMEELLFILEWVSS